MLIRTPLVTGSMKIRSVTCGFPFASRESRYSWTTQDEAGCGAHRHGRPPSRPTARFSRSCTVTGLPFRSAVVVNGWRRVGTDGLRGIGGTSEDDRTRVPTSRFIAPSG